MSCAQESIYLDKILQCDPLAQSVEHLTFNQGVPRSSRGWITTAHWSSG